MALLIDLDPVLIAVLPMKLPLAVDAAALIVPCRWAYYYLVMKAEGPPPALLVILSDEAIPFLLMFLPYCYC